MKLTIAANRGDIGGGEVMLLTMARAARDLGHDVTVVAPATLGTLVDAAYNQRFHTVEIKGGSLQAYGANLRAWDRSHRDGLLWCNGLVPASATAGHRNRVVHVHQEPQGRLQPLASRIARGRVRGTVVPSHYLAGQLPGSTVMWNWTDPLGTRRRTRRGRPVVGFLGRVTVEKGIVVLAEAMRLVNERQPGRAQLLIAGDGRFGDPSTHRAIDVALAQTGGPVVRRGWTDRADFMNAVDVAVFPSVQPEAFGLVVPEAMSARCPYIVSDAGALPEIAGDHPYVVPAGDAAALADMIERALDEPAETLDGAYERWLAEFSPDAGRLRLDDVLSQIGGD